MQGEWPQFKRCCFCLPLRRGLIGWGYVRLALDLLAVTYWLWMFLAHPRRSGGVIVCSIIISYFFIDIVFVMALIIGGHKKSVKILRVSLVYSIVWSVMYLALVSYFIYDQIRLMYWSWDYHVEHPARVVDGVMNISMFVGILIVQVYVILMTRSEMIKLQNQTLEMQFVNHAADGEARCVRAGHTDIEKEKAEA